MALALAAVVRAVPLEPVAVLGQGEVAARLIARLLADDDARLGRLRGVGGANFALILGETAELPWVDGVTYFGQDEHAARLLTPTTLAPSVPSALFERALERRFAAQASDAPAPWAVCFAPRLVIPCGQALPLTRQALSEFRLQAPLAEGT